MLFINYQRAQLDDMWFFHAPIGPVPEDQQAEILSLCKPARAEFVLLPSRLFELPPGVTPNLTLPPELQKQSTRKQRTDWARTQRKWILPAKYSVGYRHMIRFYALGLWNIVARAGYKYVMRLDEDSWLRSPVRYNLFDYMSERRLVYAYRLGNWESGANLFTGGKFHDLVREYVVSRNLTRRVESSGWLLEPCAEPRAVANYTVEQCGNALNPYSNFFITKVSFWLSDEVQDFLQVVNESQTIYYERFGDHLFHGAAMQVFLQRESVHMFQDFAYEHMTQKPVSVNGSDVTCYGYGGYALGNVSGPDLALAEQRLTELKDALGRQGRLAEKNHEFYMRCHRLRTCHSRIFNLGTGKVVEMGITLGTVTLEQPFCGRPPSPFPCVARERLPPANSTMGSALISRAALQWSTQCTKRHVGEVEMF